MAKLYYTKDIKKIFDDSINQKLRKSFDDACGGSEWTTFDDATEEMRELAKVKDFLDEMIKKMEEADKADDEYLAAIRAREAANGTAS